MKVIYLASFHIDFSNVKTYFRKASSPTFGFAVLVLLLVRLFCLLPHVNHMVLATGHVRGSRIWWGGQVLGKNIAHCDFR